jgi:ATP-dependent DNA helicase HFM1/MER3
MWEGQHKTQYINEVNAVFRHVQRLIRCIADCQISLGDSVAVNNALMLQRSLHAKAWDDGPLQMRQLPDIGIVAVRKFVTAGIKTIEELESADAHRIEMIVKRNSPFGLKLLDQIKLFPKLYVSAHILPNSVSTLSWGSQDFY